MHHGDGQVGASLLVKAQKIAIILLVDMVAGEDQQRVAAVALDKRTVLIQRIRRAAVPVLVVAPAVGLPDLQAVGSLPVEVPGLADAEMLHERVRPVLREDGDAVQIRIDRIRERKIDNPVLPAERNRRLGALLAQNAQAAAFAAGQDQRQHTHKSSQPNTASEPWQTPGRIRREF